jgi:hypothetical protein
MEPELNQYIKKNLGNVSKSFLFAGFFFACGIGFFMSLAAFGHNPQGEYSSNFWSLYLIFISWCLPISSSFFFLFLLEKFIRRLMKFAQPERQYIKRNFLNVSKDFLFSGFFFIGGFSMTFNLMEATYNLQGEHSWGFWPFYFASIFWSLVFFSPFFLLFLLAKIMHGLIKAKSIHTSE